MSDVIDIAPALRLKRTRECQHDSVSVDETCASLICDACDSEIDPWWYLRKMAADPEIASRWWGKQRADHQAWVVTATAVQEGLQARDAQLNADVKRLTDLKNQLVNEAMPDGRRLGAALVRPRRRARRPA